MLSTTTLPAGDTTTYTYNGYGRLGVAASRKPDNTLLAEYDYTRRLDGKITHIDEKDSAGVKAARDYAFDELGRLTSESYDDVTAADQDWVEQLVLDIWGNRTSRTLAKSNGAAADTVETTAYTYNNRDQLLTEAFSHDGLLQDTTVNAYDANGALLSATKHALTDTGTVIQTTSYANDLRDRAASATVTAADGSSTQEQFAYDTNGIKYRTRTILRNASNTITSDHTVMSILDSMNPTGYAQVLEERESGLLVASYVHGLEPISQFRSGVVYQYLSDAHSGIRLVITPAEALAASYLYSSFGVLMATTGTLTNPLRYRGESFDPTLGQYYLRARYYNPANGRFTRVDPLAMDIREPATGNVYGYANGDPLAQSDPSGLRPNWALWSKILALIAADAGGYALLRALGGIAITYVVGGAYAAIHNLSIYSDSNPNGDVLINRAIARATDKDIRNGNVKFDAAYGANRPDLQDLANSTVYEIKPDTAYWQRVARVQVKNYQGLLGKRYNKPFSLGTWNPAALNLAMHGLFRIPFIGRLTFTTRLVEPGVLLWQSPALDLAYDFFEYTVTAAAAFGVATEAIDAGRRLTESANAARGEPDQSPTCGPAAMRPVRR